MRPVSTFSVFSLQSYSCFCERCFFIRWGGGEGEQTADQVSVDFINLWTSNTTGLLEKSSAHISRILPTYFGKWPPLKKTAHFGAEKLWNGPKKFFLAPAHILNVFFAKKNGLRLVHFSLGEAVYKVPVDIGGSHSALCLVTQISKRDRVQ